MLGRLPIASQILDPLGIAYRIRPGPFRQPIMFHTPGHARKSLSLKPGVFVRAEDVADA